MGDQLRMMRGADSLSPRTRHIGEDSGVLDTGVPKTDGVPDKNKPSFSEFLLEQFNESNQLGMEADRRIDMSVRGEDPSPHETIIAIQKADVSFNLLLSIKDKLEQAYQTLIRTQMG